MTDVRVTQAYAQVLQQPPAPPLRVTQAYAQVLQQPPAPPLRVTQAYLLVLRSSKLRSQPNITIYHGPP